MAHVASPSAEWTQMHESFVVVLFQEQEGAFLYARILRGGLTLDGPLSSQAPQNRLYCHPVNIHNLGPDFKDSYESCFKNTLETHGFPFRK